MIDRLDGIARRYREIEAEMGRPEVASDHAQLTKLAREQRALRDTVQTYDEYRKARQEFESARELQKNERDAEDLVQDTCMRAYRFFDKFERGTNIKAWLFRILTNTFINRYRRKVKERSATEGPEQEAVQALFFSQDATDQASNPERFLFDRLLSDDVLRAIDSLPIDFRMVVILADLQEFS